MANSFVQTRIKQVFKLFRSPKTSTLKVITNPYLISCVIAVIIIINLPAVFQKYKVEVLSRNRITPDVTYYYADINNDGISEEIEFRQIRENFIALTVREKGKIIEQWNFEGRFIRSSEAIVAKVDSDSLRSIYFLTFENNKLFLNCLNPFENKIITEKKFVVDYVPFDMDDLDIEFNPNIYTNQNRKGIKEFFFSISVGYSKQPRRIFKYNPSTDLVYSSCFSYAAIPQPVLADTSARELKLLAASCAFSNSVNNDPYTDMFAWLMCYDKNLELVYKPIQIGIYPSMSDLASIKVGEKTFYICSNIYTGTKKLLSSLSLFDTSLRLVKKIEFPYTSDWNKVSLYVNKDQPEYFYIIKQNGKVEKYDSDLKVVSEAQLPPLLTPSIFNGDLDGDTETELIFISADLDKLIFVRNDFSSYVSVNCEGANKFWNYSVKSNGDKNSELIAFSNNEQLTLSYQLNYLYYLKYPLYAGVYAAVLLFVLLIQKTQRHRAELKYKTERRIAELQLRAIKNQIDPHFTLNILNSIGSLYYKNDKEKADYIFGKYSKLLRLTVLNSDKILTTLADELDYVVNYLELEKFRCNNKFCWKLDLAENINTGIKIPKMLIHTFVENAIKHGLRHLENSGELFIAVSRNSNEYEILVRDNGIGRNKAKSIEIENTGKGLNILEQILNLYYDLMKVRITYTISDLVDNEENSCGTEVVIKIPIDQ